MNDRELISWMEHCPVCGRELTRFTSTTARCIVGHGDFRILKGFIVFDLRTDVEDGEE